MMKEFLEALEQNPELKERAAALDAAGSTPAQYIALAAEYGFALTAADFAPAAAAGPVSDDALDAVAGGGATVCMMNNITYQQYKQGEIDNMLEMFKGRAGLRCPQCGKFVTPQVAEMGTYYTCPSCGHTGTDFVMCSAPR